jgi:hypothetical protein
MLGERSSRPTCGWRVDVTTIILVFVAFLACGRSPVSPSSAGVIVGQQYHFSCGSWWPQAPTVSVAVVDIQMRGPLNQSGPTPEALGAIGAAGGRISYVFHVPMVRAYMDLQRAALLVGETPGKVASEVRTVSDPSRFDVRVIVLLDHSPSEDDQRRAEALGATITHKYEAPPGYAATLADAAVPALRSLSGVHEVELDGIGCLA